MGRRLNTSTPTVIQTELVPLDENFAIEANGTLEQWYYDNTTQYAPDRSITPLILSPKIMVADKDSQQSWDDAHVTKSVVAWSVMESNTWVDITSASVLSDYELSGNNLIVHKNVSYSQGVTIKCKLTYVDPRDNGIEITTQETVLLTCNRDANVVLPEVAITSPSARSFNPLVDGASTEYDFDAVVTNSPDVEMQSSDIATYEMDGSGTEEIISDANGIAPILDIRYPDSETQTDQEFVYRQTANGEKTNEVGAAFISKIKGNTVKFNQIVKNGNFANKSMWTEESGVTFTVSNGAAHITKSTSANNGIRQNITYIASHRVFMSCQAYCATATTVKLTFSGGIEANKTLEAGKWTTISGINYGNEGRTVFYVLEQSSEGHEIIVKNVITIDLTLIYGAGNEPTTEEQFEADYKRWFGKPLSYEAYDAGSLRSVQLDAIKTTGFNQWDEQFEQDNLNTETGSKVNDSGRIRSKNYIPVFENTKYYAQIPSPYLIRVFYYDTDKNYIECMNGFKDAIEFTTPAKTAYILFAVSATYGTTYKGNICINISDPSKNGTYEPYEGHIASVPVTSAKGRLLDSNGNVVGNSVFVFPDGLKKVGNVQDEIFVENGVVKAIKRIGSVDLGTLNWNKNANNVFFDNSSSVLQLLKSSTDYVAANMLCGKFVTNAFTSVLNQQEGIAFKNAANGLLVYDDNYSGYTKEDFKTAMNGVMLYYELATPQTYVLDPVQNPFIYKWFGIDANNNEVLAETLPWYVSGQDTSKLRVDAMWGEKINVVLRAMMPTGVLSPSKAYAALTWRIPDVDTTVVSYNGSAVRSDTNSMTFGTIVNINGKNLEDSVKAANLRFKWVYRKNTTSQETVAGWSQGESDQITIQASNLRSVRAQDSTLTSTLVFPYVYCLGAWTTSQGTETGYSKPTTTKNGVTYYRIVD